MTVDEIQAKAHIARSFHCSKRHPYSSTHGKHSRYILQTEEHWSFFLTHATNSAGGRKLMYVIFHQS